MSTMFYVYVLQSKKDKKWYIGYTSDLERRLVEHQNGENISTKHRRPLDLIYYEAYQFEYLAKKREKNLKLFSKAYFVLKKRVHPHT